MWLLIFVWIVCTIFNVGFIICDEKDNAYIDLSNIFAMFCLSLILAPLITIMAIHFTLENLKFKNPFYRK